MVPSAVKKASKKLVNYPKPEDDIDFISTSDWLSRFWTNPLPHVRLRCHLLCLEFTGLHV